jgi:hypothetical protein
MQNVSSSEVKLEIISYHKLHDSNISGLYRTTNDDEIEGYVNHRIKLKRMVETEERL